MARKLYQHIITENEVKGGAEKIKVETLKVFKGRELFEGFHREYIPKDAAGDKLPTESKGVVATVEERLAWTENKIVELFDFELTKDSANMSAKADLVVGERVIAKDVPATYLLSLEKRLREIREYYDAMPTIDMSKKWEDGGRKGIRKNGPVEQYRTAKKTVPVVLAESTEKHPAQVKAETEDVQIGQFLTTYFSGAAHPQEKADRLTKIDRLIAATKRARMLANETEVVDREIGKEIFDYIHDRS
jgi:hypothetical protein